VPYTKEQKDCILEKMEELGFKAFIKSLIHIWGREEAEEMSATR